MAPPARQTKSAAWALNTSTVSAMARMIQANCTRVQSGCMMRADVKALLGDYPITRALRGGRVSSRLFALEFADAAVPNRAFKRVVRDLEFDVAELALMT